MNKKMKNDDDNDDQVIQAAIV